MSLKNEEEIKKIFGTHLKSLREGKSLSLRELDALTGIDYSTIGKMENEGANPTLLSLFTLADGLGIDITELVSFKRKDN